MPISKMANQISGFGFRPPCFSVQYSENIPHSSISFRVGSRSGSAIRASLSDAVVERSAMSFYDLLGIPETGSLLEIKQAYKQLARKYHPDVSPPDRVQEYTQRFIQVHEAYETLSNPRRRELYDIDIADGIQIAFNAPRRRGGFDFDEAKSDLRSRWDGNLNSLSSREETMTRILTKRCRGELECVRKGRVQILIRLRQSS